MLHARRRWRGQNVFNPSYFAPHQYRLFGEVSGNAQALQRVIDRGYDIVFKSLNEASGNTETTACARLVRRRGHARRGVSRRR